MGLFPGKSKSPENEDFKTRRGPYGRTPNQDAYLTKYSFVHRTICKDYLKCDIKPWRKPTGGRNVGLDGDRISFEYLPTDFLDRDCPWTERRMRRRRQSYFIMEGETYRRVVGYREIMMKREYLNYLKNLRNLEADENDQERQSKLARGGGQENVLARGRPSTNTMQAAANSRKPQASAGSHKPTTGATKKSAAGNNSGKPRSKKQKTKQKKGCLSNFFSGNWLTGSNHTPTKAELRSNVLKHQAVKKWKWPNKRKRFPVPPSDPPGKFVVLLHRLYRLPKESEERDNEWLYLSSSEESDDPEVVHHFEKELHGWMTPGISFESQKLFRHMALMWILMSLSGRNFLHKRNNYFRGHVEFSSTKGHMIPFFLTTIFLWTVLCCSVISWMDVTCEANMGPKTDKTLFLKVEQTEVKKYLVPYFVVMANLTLVAVWSLAVILGDGAMIAHYMNCWCAALHEMETSGVLDIRNKTCKNLQIFILMAASYGVMFFFDWPATVRGSCIVTSMLFLRPVLPLLRINQPAMLMVYQLLGLSIQLFILFCSRMVMCFLQIFAVILKNVCEMWNFKFCLRFKLLTKENRGELYYLELNHSLIKLWSHHKLIVLLLEQYGMVFCIAIMWYTIPQVIIFAVVMAQMILNDEGTRRGFYGNDTMIKIYSDELPTILIPYFHSGLEQIFMAAVLFIHISIDFFFTTETLQSATNAFMAGAEFVRRAGIMTCKKSHERRLILSLQWSFSPTRLRALTANRFFTLNRRSLVKFFSFVTLIFTSLIRLHIPDTPFKVIFPPKGSCNSELGQILVYGICTITKDNSAALTPKPPLPPADYYFFMEHCTEIENKYSNLTASFEYYTDNSLGGPVATANKPPFQICRVRIHNGTSLPSELEKFGRYFQDHGNLMLQDTLQIYFNLSHDPGKQNYGNIMGGMLASHLDSTGGGYCGPDHSGQVGKMCEWVEYYRDCVVVCYSKTLNKSLLLPKIWRKMGHQFVLYSDYSKVDCGVNPFGFLWKGDSFSPVDPAYDCFGKMIHAVDFDLCGNIPLREPMPPFTYAKGDQDRLYRVYESGWRNISPKSVVAPPPGTTPACDQCYDHQSSRERCASPKLVKDHCPYSRYWGQQSSQKGYYLAHQCFQYDIDILSQPKPTGFCEWDYVEGGVLAGHVINQTTYSGAKVAHWDKEWDLKMGELPPCEQPSLGKLRPIMNQLYFQHACLLHNSPPGNCSAPDLFYFNAYRPYELVNCKLRQIKLDYEKDGGNSQICDLGKRTMLAPDRGKPINLTLKGGSTTTTYEKFYGCHGKQLFPSVMGYICTSPILGGVCEVDAEQGHLLYWDCVDGKVRASAKAVIGQVDNRRFGMCTAHLDRGTSTFKDFKRKVVSDELIGMIRNRQTWESGDPWNTSIQIWTTNPTFTISVQICDPRYCGSNSVPLHYPYDGRDSVASGDKFQCNWEAYWRDCLHPYQSNVWKPSAVSKLSWVYLPKWVNETSLMQPQKQRKMHPILNVFLASSHMVGCDGRKLPEENGGGGRIDSYWKDDCGWVMTPDFVDGDPKGIAVMPPILPIRHDVYGEDGKVNKNLMLHCFQTEMALYRCTDPEIFPICQSTLSSWEPSRDVINNNCFRFNTSCYKEFNKQPNGSFIPPTHPEGYCRGYCPQADISKDPDLLHENFIAIWRTLHKLSFAEPPCKNRTVAPSLFVDPQNPRDIEHHLFFEFHCSDKTRNGAIRDYVGNTSGSFHWPMYKDEKTNTYKFVPLQPLMDHLTGIYGSSCDYGGERNEDFIYPRFAVHNKTNVSRDNFLGCHGLPLVGIRSYMKKYPMEFSIIGVTNILRDYPKVCYGLLMGGWCEADVQPFYFLRDDFKVTCDGSVGSIPTTCPTECTEMQGHFANSSLSKEIEDVPGGEYWPFVKSTRGFILPKNYSRETYPTHLRKDIPYRYLTTSEFPEVKRKWAMFQHSTKQVDYIREFQDLLRGPDHHHCYHSDPVKFKKYCTWLLYVQQCYVPCKVIHPQRIVTNVSQSLVHRYPGQGDVYLRPLLFISRNSTTGFPVVEPAFSFSDCAIDPSEYVRKDTMGCNLKLLTGHDHFKWANFPEFFPDYANQVKNPATGISWVPWALGLPQKINFTYELLTDYVNPNVTYASTVLSTQKYKVTQDMFVSPYLACHRVTHDDMRAQILTGIETYWNSTVISRLQSIPSHFSYFPNSSSAVDKTCQETAVHAYVYWKACKFWNIPSKVLRIYGFCRVIFPAVVVHGAYAALSEKMNYTPPGGCINKRTDPQTFNSIYNVSNGFGLKYSMADVYDKWNDLCAACAYTRGQHTENLLQTWCGWKQDGNPTCLSPMESHNPHRKPIEIGQGIFYRWNNEVRQFGVLWKLAVEYSCWSNTKNQWQFHTRWETYHPWSLKREASNVTAFSIHIAMNALACEYPCRGPDETEDCNSKCPHHLHNPCDNNNWNNGKIFQFAHYNYVTIKQPHPPMGLNYTVTLKENGLLCQAQLLGLNDNPQGLGIFGSYGVNFIQCPGQQCLPDREGANIYLATSERILLDDKFIPPRGSTSKNNIYYSEIIVSRTGVQRDQQAVITDTGEAPRMMVVHPGHYPGYTGPSYSTFCAGFPSDYCEFTRSQFSVAGGNITGWPSIDKFLYCNKDMRAKYVVHNYHNCKNVDWTVLSTLQLTDPTKPWGSGDYCCIPYQAERTLCGPNSPNAPVKRWTDKFWKTYKGTWEECRDVLNSHGKSVFGYPFRWDRYARYLTACPQSLCKTNAQQCSNIRASRKPQGITKLCERHFDPEEKFIQNPLPKCQLPLNP